MASTLDPLPPAGLNEQQRRNPAIHFGLRKTRGRSEFLDLFANRNVAFSFNTRVAIRKACDLLGLQPGDEVLAPEYNCGSELDPLHDAGLCIRLYPVGRDTFVDPAAVEAMIGPRTRAIYLTHYFGFLQPKAGALREVCDRYRLYLIEDCALSLLSGAKPAEGRHGHVSVFCFYKFFPVMGGGALVYNGEAEVDIDFGRSAPTGVVVKRLVKEAIKRMPGFTRLLGQWKRRQATMDTVEGVDDTFPDMPSHYYFDPDLRDRQISGLCLRALSRMDVSGAIEKRRRNYLHFVRRLAGHETFVPLFPDLPGDAVPLNLPLLVPGGARTQLIAILKQEGLESVAWWSGYNRHVDFSGAETGHWLKGRLLVLPIHQYLGGADVDVIANKLCAIHQQFTERRTSISSEAGSTPLTADPSRREA